MTWLHNTYEGWDTEVIFHDTNTCTIEISPSPHIFFIESLHKGQSFYVRIWKVQNSRCHVLSKNNVPTVFYHDYFVNKTLIITSSFNWMKKIKLLMYVRSSFNGLQSKPTTEQFLNMWYVRTNKYLSCENLSNTFTSNYIRTYIQAL